MPPMKLARRAMLRAIPALPFLAMGWPSIMVQAEAGAPGVSIRMAVMEPP